MEKSVFTREYDAVLRLLKQVRRDANMTQIELAERLQEGQSFVSKFERGERRLDIVQLRTICHALGTTLPEFVTALERRLARKKPRRKSSP